MAAFDFVAVVRDVPRAARGDSPPPVFPLGVQLPFDATAGELLANLAVLADGPVLVGDADGVV